MKAILYFVLFILTFLNIRCGASDYHIVDENENFEEFFKVFSSDPEFQLNRVKFPLSYYSYDIEDKLEDVEIMEKEWDFIDFREDEKANDREVDAYDGSVSDVRLAG
jgi:hypothetical protein